jgi:hypothetical protein
VSAKLEAKQELTGLVPIYMGCTEFMCGAW